MKLGTILDRLTLAAKLAVFVLGTKDKTVLNHVSKGLDKAKAVKDMFKPSPDETLRRGDSGKVVVGVLFAVTFLLMVAHGFCEDFVSGEFWSRGQLP